MKMEGAVWRDPGGGATALCSLWSGPISDLDIGPDEGARPLNILSLECADGALCRLGGWRYETL
jgi:hypothetical protein